MYCSYSSRHIIRRMSRKSAVPFTGAKDRLMTGQVPWSSRYFPFFHISSVSKIFPHPACSTEKKRSTMFRVRVFPKRLGRVINVTLSPFSHHSRIKSVLST